MVAAVAVHLLLVLTLFKPPLLEVVLAAMEPHHLSRA
jgi:hypothetical protein